MKLLTDTKGKQKTGATASLSLTEAELRLAADSDQSSINPTQALSLQELVPVTFPELSLSYSKQGHSPAWSDPSELSPQVTDVFVWMYASGSASTNQHVVFSV